MIDQGRGGSIVITSFSIAGLIGALDGSGGIGGYSAAKHGVVGLMRGYAKVLGSHNIRVNPSVRWGSQPNRHRPGVRRVYEEDPEALMPLTRALPVSILERSDVTDAVLRLVSDAAKYVTGVTLPVERGAHPGVAVDDSRAVAKWRGVSRPGHSGSITTSAWHP